MLYLINFNIKEGMAEEFQKFLKDNEKALAKCSPKGWTYRGDYFYVLGFGNYTAVEIWEITDYADFDTYRNHDDPTWLRLTKQGMEFTTADNTPAWLLREAGDTKITEPKKKP